MFKFPPNTKLQANTPFKYIITAFHLPTARMTKNLSNLQT